LIGRREFIRSSVLGAGCFLLHRASPFAAAAGTDGSPRTLVDRTNAIAPIITISEASARITNYWRFDLPHLLD
jgi:hypothetical protein